MKAGKKPEPEFSKRAMAEARKIDGDDKLFKAAADALQKAVDDKDEKAETFCRQVFGAYAHILHTRGNAEEADTWNLATLYSIPGEGGLNPRSDPDPAQEKYRGKNNSKIVPKLAQPEKTAPSAPGDDDDIPF